MRKNAAYENRGGKGISVALTAVIVWFGCTGTVAAAGHARWPRTTYYTVVARPGDTVDTIGVRYRVSPVLVARINGLNGIGHLFSGRMVFVPASNHRTREAVLSEALDRSTPNYATPPKTLLTRYSPVRLERSVKSVSSAAYLPPGSRGAPVQQGPELRFSWPIAGPVISSFGAGEHGMRNEGINIAAELGAPFRAAADGTVSYVGLLRGYGNLILITHAHGYVTAYAHAENVAVARGEEVGKGQVIGTAGASGGVDRPQLHFEIRRGVKPVDPNLLLAANG